MPQRRHLCPTFPCLPPTKAAKGNNSCQPPPSCVFLRCSWIINYWVSVSEFPWLSSTCLRNIKVYRSVSAGSSQRLSPPCHSPWASEAASALASLTSFHPSVRSARCLERKTVVPLKMGLVGKEIMQTDSNVWQLCGSGWEPAAMK